MPEIQTIVLKVGMHCEGCARKVKKALSGMSGLDELKVDYSGQKVTVKGALDEKKVLQTLSKIGKPGEILQVIVEPKKQNEEKKEAPKEPAPPPQAQTVVLKAMLHCEGCGRKVKDAIKKVPGVQEVTVNFKEQKVIVKGFVDANKVLQKALKTGKNVVLCPPEKPKDVPKENKGATTEEKKDASTGVDKKEASKGDNKDTSKDGKQAPEDKKDNSKGEKKDAPKENKTEAKNASNNDTKDGPKEASKNGPKEEKKDTPKADKKEAKEEKKDAPKEDKEKQKEDKKGTPKDEKKKEESKDEKKTPSKDEKKEEPKVVVEEFVSPYMVYRCDAPQLFSEDNPNACIIM